MIDANSTLLNRKQLLTQGHKTKNDLVSFTMVICSLLSIAILSIFNLIYWCNYVKIILYSKFENIITI